MSTIVNRPRGVLDCATPLPLIDCGAPPSRSPRTTDAAARPKPPFPRRAVRGLLLCALLPLNAGPTTAATDLAPPAKADPIPWSEIGARAGADYRGDGLAVTPTESGARVRCVFQQLESEATGEGLWLTSTVTNGLNDRFRVMATAVEREASEGSAAVPNRSASPAGRAQAALGSSAWWSAAAGDSRAPLPRTGSVEVAGKVARFIRPGLTEEYSVSMDGVRQDFLVLEKPAGAGQLQVRLDVAGARVEQALGGAQLVLAQSGRKIAYSRVRVTDANGRKLPARLEVASASATKLAVLVDDTEAVYPVRIDPTFSDANWVSMGGVPGTDNRVYAAVVDGLGNLYIGGEFTVVGDVIANYIAKWDGSSWSALGSGMDTFGYVSALAVSGGEVYAGGSFTNAGGSAANYIAKWDGSNWSALGSGMGGGNSSFGPYVSALAVSGSDMYAGATSRRREGRSPATGPEQTSAVCFRFRRFSPFSAPVPMSPSPGHRLAALASFWIKRPPFPTRQAGPPVALPSPTTRSTNP